MTVPFSATEDAVVASERRRWPMSILVEFHLAVELDVARLAEAVKVAVARHPSAGARTVPLGPLTTTRNWERVRDLDIDPLWVGADVERCLSRPVSLSTAPPFRLLVNAMEGKGTRLSLVAHHGVFDGEGAALFLREIAHAYTGMGSAATGDPPNLDPRRRVRADPGSGRRTLADIGEVLWPPRSTRVPSPRSLRGLPSRGRDRGFGLTYWSISPEDLSAMEVALSGRGTINDALVATMHLAVDRWLARSGRDSGRLSVTVPISGRVTSDEYRSIGNHAGQATIWSVPEQRRDAEQLLRVVNAQTRVAKDRVVVDPNAAALGMTARLPARVRGVLPALVSTVTFDRTQATTRVSNLGRIATDALEHPSFDTRSVWFSPPCRPPQTIVMGAVGFRGSLFVTFRWCRPMWDEVGGEAFAGIYENAFTALLAGAGDASA